MSQYIDIRKEKTGTVVAELIEALKSGQVIIAPTDTLYGLLADAFQETAVRQIYHMKQRPEGMPLPLIAGSPAQVSEVVVFSRLAQRLADRFWPGPLTLALPALERVPEFLKAEDGTLAIRIPAHSLCRELALGVGRPLTATSANLSGQPAARAIADLAADLANQVYAVVDQGTLTAEKPSTILKVTEEQYRVVREGAIPVQEIQASLGEDIFEEG